MLSKLKLTSNTAPDVNHVSTLKAACLNSTGPRLSDQIKKNTIISKYNVSCQSMESNKRSPYLKKWVNYYTYNLPYHLATLLRLLDETKPKSSISGQGFEAWSRNYCDPQVFQVIFGGWRCCEPLRSQFSVLRNDWRRRQIKNVGFLFTVRTKTWLRGTN